ncbi:MAG TPA: hypothetical protein PLY93_07105, partial [Turneriella sp.]|nr:hypothetical protein [Turneriella sp.]
RVRTLVELRHTAKDELSGIMILFFLNSDRRAFVGGADGLEFALPENAKLEQASISVGSGSSNIQWLKLNPEKKTNGIYTVGQNVKPGDRVMQITFKMPYTQQKASLQFTPLYPQDTGLQLLVEPEDVLVRQGDKTLTRQHDKNLGRSLIAFNAAEKKVAFQLSGGGIAPVQATEEVEVVVTSPLSLTQKLLFPVVAVFVFVCALFVMTKRREN